MTTLLSIADLSVEYAARSDGARALEKVDFSLERGERLALIGESGSGKSTLALAIAGLLPGDAIIGGSIEWPGLGRTPRNGADIGFIFQDSGGTLDPVMTVGRQISEVVESNLGLGRHAARQRAIDLLGRVRLPKPVALYDAYPHQLSGGQKQRVGIAAAIAGNPLLLIADEPTSALDTIVQAEIVALIDGLVREIGMALLFVSHDIALAANHSDRLAVLRHGQIEELGSSRDIVWAPNSDYTRSLLASVLALAPQDPQTPGRMPA